MESPTIDGPVRILDRSALPAPSLRLPNGGAVVYPPRATFGPRLQGDYQLVLVHTGAARVTVDGVAREIPPGHVGLLRPGGTEFFAFARETRHSWIALPPDGLEGDLRAALDAAPPLLPLSAAMEACVALGRDSAAVDDPARRPVLAAVARAALTLYVAEAARPPDGGLGPGVHPAVARAHAIARERACDGLGVAELAREVHLSAEHLVRLFRRDLGVTPGAVLRATRLSHGMSLLTHTGLTVAEVAHQSGFASPHHFAGALRAAVGLSPTELRARGWAARAPAPPFAPGLTPADGTA